MRGRAYTTLFGDDKGRAVAIPPGGGALTVPAPVTPSLQSQPSSAGRGGRAGRSRGKVGVGVGFQNFFYEMVDGRAHKGLFRGERIAQQRKSLAQHDHHNAQRDLVKIVGAQDFVQGFTQLVGDVSAIVWAGEVLLLRAVGDESTGRV